MPNNNLNVTRTGNQVSVTSTEGDAFRQTQTAANNNPLNGLTLAQALTYIDNNVTDLASARTALKHLTRLVFLLRAEYERGRK
jgi:hypothetical protein